MAPAVNSRQRQTLPPMDIVCHAEHPYLTARIRQLSRENEELKQQARNAEAEVGWFKAQWHKDARRQTNQPTSHVRNRIVQSHQWSCLQKELRQHKRLTVALRASKSALQAQIDDSEHEKRRLDQSLGCIQDHVARLCRRYMKSSMVAAAFSELPPEELLDLLECHVERAMQEIRTRSVQDRRTITRLQAINKNQKQTIQDLRDDVEATEQAQQEGIRVLEATNHGWHERLGRWQTETQALQRLSMNLLSEGMTVAESTQVQSRTCPHLDRQMVSHTSCSTCLCEDCDRQARASTYNGHDTVECLHCSGVCTVMALPTWWHRLWTNRWERVRSQTESICKTLDAIGLT